MTSRAIARPPPWLSSALPPTVAFGMLSDIQMIRRIISTAVLLVSICLVVLSCSKSAAPDARAASTTSSNQVVTALAPLPVWQLHWRGQKQLARSGAATNFLALWNLPESTNLTAQTLDKLASAPWRLLPAAAPLSNAPIALLRPLLDDVLQEGFQLEAHGHAPHPESLVFAIRLDAARAATWQTNLGAVLASLTGLPPVANALGWTLRKHDAPDYWQLLRVKEWTLLGAATGPTNALLATVQARLQNDLQPFPTNASAPGTWLEATLPLAALGRGFFMRAGQSDLPVIHFTVTGESGGVRLNGEATFSQAFAAGQPEAWQIPTNLIHDPLGTFTAFRGLQSIAGSNSWLSFAAPDSLPDQFYSWGIAGSPFETFFALPTPSASNWVSKISDLAIASGSAFLKTNGTNLERMTNATGLTWRNLPFLQPWLQSVTVPAGNFIAGGYVPSMRTNRPAPSELLAQLQADPGLVYYDWEFTGARIEAWIYLAQTLRLSFNLAQLPPDSASGKWIQVLMPQLGNTVTAVTRTSDRQLTFTRKGDLGLTGLEVHLLADWLEAPNFPSGWHTRDVAPASPIRVRRH